jgi:DNA-directed RNA polymerase subunit F
MTKPQVVEENPLNIVEVKEMLKKIKERDTELNFRAQKTAEYLEAINTIKPKSAKELKEKLEGLEIPRVKEAQIHKLIEIMPLTAEGVKTIFTGLNISVTADNIKKVVTLMQEYAPAQKKQKEEEPAEAAA